RVDPQHSEYVAASLQSARLRRVIRERQVGGNREGLTFQQLGSLRVHLPEDLGSALPAIRDLNREVKFTRGALEEWRECVAEYKQALITAAVTGKLDVTTASGRGAPV